MLFVKGNLIMKTNAFNAVNWHHTDGEHSVYMLKEHSAFFLKISEKGVYNDLICEQIDFVRNFFSILQEIFNFFNMYKCVSTEIFCFLNLPEKTYLVYQIYRFLSCMLRCLSYLMLIP